MGVSGEFVRDSNVFWNHSITLPRIVSELASEYDGKIVVGKCDVEENEDIAMEFGVRNIPTLLFFKDGKLVDKFVGSAKKPALVEKFQALL